MFSIQWSEWWPRLSSEIYKVRLSDFHCGLFLTQSYCTTASENMEYCTQDIWTTFVMGFFRCRFSELDRPCANFIVSLYGKSSIAILSNILFHRRKNIKRCNETEVETDHLFCIAAESECNRLSKKKKKIAWGLGSLHQLMIGFWDEHWTQNQRKMNKSFYRVVQKVKTIKKYHHNHHYN